MEAGKGEYIFQLGYHDGPSNGEKLLWRGGRKGTLFGWDNVMGQAMEKSSSGRGERDGTLFS